MSKTAPLLPAGFYDLLPDDAALESGCVSRLLGAFSAFGYEQVSPPLMEFETSLFEGRGEELARQTFRVLDPVSKNMMGVRADMTLQVARIAASRLASVPRPLRLCYAGQILQTVPEALRNERQLTQAGMELIGSDALQADIEVITIAAWSLEALGITDITIDINLPGLVAELCPEAKNDPALQARIKDAVTRKDAEMIAKLPVKASSTLAALVGAAGPAAKALTVLDSLNIPQVSALRELTQRVARHCPSLALTIDPIEYRGFDYHNGISFSIFARGLRYELGRGGRYTVEGEPATGFTIYVTPLLGILPRPAKPKKLLVGKQAAMAKVKELQSQGWVTLYALTDDLSAEAKKLGVRFYLSADGKQISEI
ncbi:MAG TPA: ATP phosphoribosyltransferase regulatory subunit [Rickettsiales bacterium]|nr:ATP phosphoribosyltransferase regulatory subunit [Rickettsiales bacterium]